ncbi:hypothetical protein C0J52_19781 [Blattella germanica]|nr:hypothetical protein C0J52_19781 [Blattella germanica]
MLLLWPTTHRESSVLLHLQSVRAHHQQVHPVQPSAGRGPNYGFKFGCPNTHMVLHKLESEDHVTKSEDLLEVVAEEILMNHVMFSDEVNVCVVNKHNCRIWTEEQPNEFIEWQRDSPKVNVWLRLMKDRIYGENIMHLVLQFAERNATHHWFNREAEWDWLQYFWLHETCANNDNMSNKCAEEM